MAFVRFAARTLAAIGLLAFFFCLWCGLRVSTAISQGALEKPGVCFDGPHFRDELAGRVKQRTVNSVLARTVWAHYYDQPERSIPHHLLLASSSWGWSMFWNEQQRRAYYTTIAPKMMLCPGALRYLQREGQLTPAIIAAARERYAMQNRPFPEITISPSAAEPRSP